MRLDLLWASADVPAQKGSVVVGFLCYAADVGIPRKVMAKFEAQVLC